MTNCVAKAEKTTRGLMAFRLLEMAKASNNNTATPSILRAISKFGPLEISGFASRTAY